jgi:dynein intermediate chain 1
MLLCHPPQTICSLLSRPSSAQPVLSFDLRAPVGDVAWAPFSSTVFAAVTDAGKVFVFDLAVSRAAPVCVQKVARKARLTKLAFNAAHPVLLVGTEQGAVTCLKLSPNLRRTHAPGEHACRLFCKE